MVPSRQEAWAVGEAVRIPVTHHASEHPVSTIAVPWARRRSTAAVVHGVTAAATCVGSALAAAAVGTAGTAVAVTAFGAAAGWAAAATVYAVAAGLLAGGVGRSGEGSGDASGWRGDLARRVVGSRWSYVAAAVCGPVTLAAAVRVGGAQRVPRAVVAGWAAAFGLAEAGWQTLVIAGLL